jgi:small subunit ribosomal protein S2e
MSGWVVSAPGGSHWHSRGHHLGQALHCPCAERLLGNKIGKTHTIPCQGDRPLCISFLPPGALASYQLCAQEAAAAGYIDDCYTSARGCTATLGNFAKVTFDAISRIYSYLTPNLWKESVFTKSPYQEFTDHLVKTYISVSMRKTQAPAVATT